MIGIVVVVVVDMLRFGCCLLDTLLLLRIWVFCFNLVSVSLLSAYNVTADLMYMSIACVNDVLYICYAGSMVWSTYMMDIHMHPA